jgi:hypothetical protein
MQTVARQDYLESETVEGRRDLPGGHPAVTNPMNLRLYIQQQGVEPSKGFSEMC